MVVNKYIQYIFDNTLKVEALQEERKLTLEKRLKEQSERKIGVENFDQNRWQQEVFYYIEKYEISEEIDRLKVHIELFEQTQKQAGSIGKKLNFICQEIGREINTIGSKANFAPIQHLVIQMKDDLEKVREQTANIL